MTSDLLIQVSLINYAFYGLSGVEKLKNHETSAPLKTINLNSTCGRGCLEGEVVAQLSGFFLTKQKQQIKFESSVLGIFFLFKEFLDIRI